jgi:hypothetical protein
LIKVGYSTANYPETHLVITRRSSLAPAFRRLNIVVTTGTAIPPVTLQNLVFLHLLDDGVNTITSTGPTLCRIFLVICCHHLARLIPLHHASMSLQCVCHLISIKRAFGWEWIQAWCTAVTDEQRPKGTADGNKKVQNYMWRLANLNIARHGSDEIRHTIVTIVT